MFCNILQQCRHSQACGGDISSRWNKSNGILVSCPDCVDKVVKINSNPSGPQLFRDLIDDIDRVYAESSKYRETKANVMRILQKEKLKFITEYNQRQNGGFDIKWFDYYSNKYYKKLHKEKGNEFKWFWSDWSQDDLDNLYKLEQPNYSGERQQNWAAMRGNDKGEISRFVKYIGDVFTNNVNPTDIHLIGFSIILCVGREPGQYHSERHWDRLWQGIPLIITMEGNYTASPGSATNKISLHEGDAYTYLSWKWWGGGRHGYSPNIKGDPTIKLMLKFQSKKILMEVWNNTPENHGFLEFNKKEKEFKYKEFIQYDANDTESKYEKEILDRNRKSKKRKRIFTSKKRRTTNIKRA